jgi:ferredoxin
MKAVVDKNLCMGCELCMAIAPDDFKITDEGVAEASRDEIENDEEVSEALNSCPVDAITRE